MGMLQGRRGGGRAVRQGREKYGILELSVGVKRILSIFRKKIRSTFICCGKLFKLAKINETEAQRAEVSPPKSSHQFAAEVELRALCPSQIS